MCVINHVKTGKSTYINFVVGSVVAVDDSKFGESGKNMHLTWKMSTCSVSTLELSADDQG